MVCICLCLFTVLQMIILFSILVPIPSVMITAPDTQIVGQSLVLTCSGSVVRGITSEVDIVWKSDGSKLSRTNEVNLTLMENGTSLTYMDNYTIAQLSTYDKDKVYYCELVISSHPPIAVNSSILLNVTGKFHITHFVCFIKLYI